MHNKCESLIVHKTHSKRKYLVARYVVFLYSLIFFHAIRRGRWKCDLHKPLILIRVIRGHAVICVGDSTFFFPRNEYSFSCTKINKS